MFINPADFTYIAGVSAQAGGAPLIGQCAVMLRNGLQVTVAHTTEQASAIIAAAARGVDTSEQNQGRRPPRLSEN